ncbi:MAG: reverse transcriptase family protein [Candidatus Omnitrophica bacterium]|nr:reverse transcriptase family protein [Candidatus Omnitrophota bacterium]
MHSVVPQQWLEANVIPIYKKNEASDPSNYRPISLTVVVSKVMERILRDSLLQYLLENRLLTKDQHGFLPNKSTLTNVLSSTNMWIKAVNNNKSVHAIYLDFAKAFDSVSHPKLIYKLSKYGINGNLLKWIKAFLYNRKQYVLVDGIRSFSCIVRSGVPQGTVLGPILFAIYINDLVDVVKNSYISLYADDVKLYIYIDKNENKSGLLQDDLVCVHEWSKDWQLNVAINKSSVFTFGGSVGTPIYSVGDLDLELVSEINDLGFHIDSNKKFSSHCKIITKKAMRISANIFRVFKIRETKFLFKMFDTYVRTIV